MSSKEFCESGKHIYKEVDIVKSLFEPMNTFGKSDVNSLWIVVACSKCDSKFLRLVTKPIP